MKKVFCEDCQDFNFNCGCWSDKYVETIDTPTHRKDVPGNCLKINKNNNCKDFRPYLKPERKEEPRTSGLMESMMSKFKRGTKA